MSTSSQNPRPDSPTSAPTPDQVRTEALQPGDQIRHPREWTLFTVSAVPEKLKVDLRFHNRKTDESESGMRVTGVDGVGEVVYVDAAQSFLWHREARQPISRPVSATPDDTNPTALTPDGPLCRCGHGQSRHYVDTAYGAPVQLRGCYDCTTGSHRHQFEAATTPFAAMQRADGNTTGGV